MFKLRRGEVVPFGGEEIEVPKLTIEKWKLLITQIETLPSLIVNVLSAKDQTDFAVTVTAAAELAIDEVVRIVSVLTGKDPEWIEANVDLKEMIGFISATAKKNDLVEAAKKCRAALSRWSGSPQEPSH